MNIRFLGSFVSVIALATMALTACGSSGGAPSRSSDASPTAADAHSSLPDAQSLAVDATPCTPIETPEVTCNGIDDDCDGQVDNIDIGGDGICDCLRIGIIGASGANPSANFLAWLQARGTTVARLGLDSTPLTNTLLQEFDLVILDQLVREYDGTEAQILLDWVQAGGGVMSMSGYTGSSSDTTRPNGLLAKTGLRYESTLVSGPITDFVSHPLTQGLSSVTFLGGYHVAAASGQGGTNTVVATLNANSVGTAQERGTGHVFLWGDEWIEFDSEWSTMQQIETFWVNIVGWLGPRDSCQVRVN